jgi:hypothetical protein
VAKINVRVSAVLIPELSWAVSGGTRKCGVLYLRAVAVVIRNALRNITMPKRVLLGALFKFRISHYSP